MRRRWMIRRRLPHPFLHLYRCTWRSVKAKVLDRDRIPAQILKNWIYTFFSATNRFNRSSKGKNLLSVTRQLSPPGLYSFP